MNLPRIRELHAAWVNGSIRIDELCELRDALPEVFALAERLAHWEGVCSRCAEHTDDQNPFVADGPGGSRVCFECFAATLEEFAYFAGENGM